MNGICSQDDSVRDSVIGEGEQSRNAVREDTEDVYDWIAM